MTVPVQVRLLGEPALKGGGAFPSDAIWLGYPQRGLQLEFAGCSWDQADLRIASAWCCALLFVRRV